MGAGVSTTCSGAGVCVTQTTQAQVIQSFPGGSIATLTPVGGAPNIVDMGIADLDNDGFLDVVLLDAANNQLNIFINNKAGGFNAPTAVTLMVKVCVLLVSLPPLSVPPSSMRYTE